MVPRASKKTTPPLEPEDDGARFSTHGGQAGDDVTKHNASARRLAAASEVTGELEKARASVGSFKSSLGKVQQPAPEQVAKWSAGMHTLDGCG